MRWPDLIRLWAFWRTYFVALWVTFRYPTATVARWCDDPTVCTLEHRFVLVQSRGKALGLALKHQGV